MKYEVKVPAVGESITEATIGSWNKKNGEAVKRNDVLMSLETDKATVEVVAEQDGVLQIKAEAGQVVPIGSIAAWIDSDAVATVTASKPAATTATPAPAAKPAVAAAPQAAPQLAAAGANHSQDYSPAVSRIVAETGLNTAGLTGTGRDGRLTKADVLTAVSTPQPTPAKELRPTEGSVKIQDVINSGELQKRVPMTTIRRKIAERLVKSQHNTATLTTFNEIDMTHISALRLRYKDQFKEKYGVSLGFMGIFVKAAVEALKANPAVNAFIDGNDILYNNFYNIGVAVSTEKGLLVPVIKNADQLSVAGIEMAIRNFALKARDGKISVDDLSGGTFTISNGGVFGSLMSTPILNPPQSGILGMHKVEDRPVAVNGKVEIRPMMYVALSYDHRMIDGKEAVTFLVKIKEGVEDPERLLIGV